MIAHPGAPRLSLLALLACLAAGCAAAPPLKEFVGKPHVAIAKVSRQKVAERLIEAMLANGYTLGHYRLIRGKGYEIRFSKKAGSRTGAGFANLFGGAETPAPDLVVDCRVDGNQEETRATAVVTAANPSAPAARAHPFINAENHRIQAFFNGLRQSLAKE